MVDHGIGGNVQRVFRYLLAEARRAEAGLRATCVTGSASDFPAARDYAHTHVRRAPGLGHGARVAVVTVAPKMHAADPSRIAGVLAHELAHAVLLVRGDDTHTEAAADAFAEQLFGVRIVYDRDDVQAIDAPGVRPRPPSLPR